MQGFGVHGNFVEFDFERIYGVLAETKEAGEFSECAMDGWDGVT
jgi:hypothetical protein